MKYSAIAICRVSTSEQKLSNSLNRQEQNVIKAARLLEVDIIKTISGDVSSKVGKNYDRPDLKEAFSLCKNSKSIKYLIVDEVDRFMRSVSEMFYWITKFKEEAGVTVYFASNPELNTDDARARLLLSLDGFKAEGSNEERQRKSINGHVQALNEGRYTFPPKPGYMKGNIPGVHIPHPITFEPLQTAFKEVISGLYTPIEALKRLNKSDFTKIHSTWNMDKFRRFATDLYYAGILSMNKQVKAIDIIGQHQAMISKEEHQQLVKLFTGTLIPRGPKKQYNPDFPMNKIMTCEDCDGVVKFTGSRKNNGYAKKTTHYYFKYHCRGCGKGYHRDEVHNLITERIEEIKYKGHQQEDFIEALEMVWRQKQQDKLQEIKTLQKHLEESQCTKSSLVIEMARADISLKDDLRKEIDSTKAKIVDLENKLEHLSTLDNDLIEFTNFGLSYTDELMQDWWDLDHENRVRCQQLVFPGGISFNSTKKVGTPEISALYSLEPIKKDSRFSQKSLMVELAGTAPASASLSLLEHLQV